MTPRTTTGLGLLHCALGACTSQTDFKTNDAREWRLQARKTLGILLESQLEELRKQDHTSTRKCFDPTMATHSIVATLSAWTLIMQDHSTHAEHKNSKPLRSHDDIVLDGSSLGLRGMDVAIMAGHCAGEDFLVDREGMSVRRLVVSWAS